MASNLFVQFSDGVQGESEDENHPGSAGWCEIIDLGLEIEQEEDVDDEDEEMTRIVTEPVKFTKYVDTASPQLIQGLAKATPYATVKIEALRAYGKDGTSDPVPYLVIELKDVFISEIKSSYDEGDLPKEEIELIWGQMTFSYTPMDKRTGEAKPVIPISFNNFTMKTQ